MNAAAHLVIVVGDALWPALESILYWQRQPEGLRRLVLYHTEDPTASREPARRLERYVREQFPELDLLRREGGSEPRHLRRQLESWVRDNPDVPWILDITGASPSLVWGAETWLARPDLRVVRRQSDLAWIEYRRSPEGDAEAFVLPEARRDATDALPLHRLLTLLWSDPATPPEVRVSPAPDAPSSLVALTEAGIQNGWRWADGFRALSLNPANGSTETSLFAQYLAGLVVSLGVSKPHLGQPTTPDGGTPEDDGPAEMWFQLGGRLVVLDVDLTEAKPADATTPSPLQRRVARASRIRKAVTGPTIEWVLIRPALRLDALETALVQSARLTCLDQADCHTLPSRLAALFARPLSPEGIEAERLLSAHLLRTGHTRAFCPEPAALQPMETASDSADPLWALADDWADRVMQERDQNWLLSLHRGRSFLRVPTDSRPNAETEWRLLVLHTSGLPDAEVTARTDRRTASVVVHFPSASEPDRRVAAWLRPFLNRRLSFAEAQTRFAVQARVEAEAAHASGAAARPAPGSAAPPSRPAPARSGPRPPAPRPASPAPQPRGRPAPPPKPPRTSLADLDRALDDALGG